MSKETSKKAAAGTAGADEQQQRLQKRNEGESTGELQKRGDGDATLTDEQRAEQAEIERRKQEQDTARSNTDTVEKGAGADGAALMLNDPLSLGQTAVGADAQANQDEIERRRQEQAIARANAQGMISGFSEDMLAMLTATQEMLAEGIKNMPGTDVARVLRVALSLSGMLSDPASLAPADAAVVNRATMAVQNAGSAQPLVDEAQLTQSERDQDMVFVNVPRAYRLRLDNGSMRAIKPGAQKLPRDIAEHAYSKQNGVKTVE